MPSLCPDGPYGQARDRIWRGQFTHILPWDAQALIRRKVRVVDRGEIQQIKIPFPLPLAWGRTVIPYAPDGVRAAPKPTAAEDADAAAAESASESAPEGRLLEVESMQSTTMTPLLKQDFQVVLLLLLPGCYTF